VRGERVLQKKQKQDANPEQGTPVEYYRPKAGGQLAFSFFFKPQS